MRTVFALVACVGFALPGSAAQPPTPEQAVQARIDTLIDALKTKNFDKAMADWPADSPNRVTFRTYLNGILPPPGFTGKFEDVTLSRWTVTEKEVAVRLRIVANVTAIKGTDNYRSTMVFNARFTRTADGVQWMELTHGATDAAVAIRAATSREEALRILKENTDIPPRHLAIRTLKQTIAAIDSHDHHGAKMLIAATGELARIDPARVGPFAEFTAGVLARAEGQPALAARHFLRAVEGFATQVGMRDEELQARARLVDALVRNGELKEAEQAAAAAVTVATKTNNPGMMVTALSNHGYALSVVGRRTEAAEQLRAALKIERERQLPGGGHNVLLNLGNVARERGNPRLAKETLEEALRLAVLADDRKDIAYSLSNLAALAVDQGRYAEAQALHGMAHDIFREMRYAYGVMATRNGMAVVHMYRGAIDNAYAVFAQNHEVARQLGDLPAMGTALLNMGECDLRRGRYSDALRLFSLVSEGAANTNDRPMQASIQKKLGNLHAELGDLARARFHWAYAARLAKENDDPTDEAEALLGMAMVETSWGNHEKARTFLLQALGLAQKSGAFRLELAVAVNFASLHQKEGNEAQALAAMQQVVDKATRAGSPGTEAEIRVRFGHLLLRVGKLDEADAEFQRSRKLMEHLTRQSDTYFRLLVGEGDLAIARKDWKAGIPSLRAAIEVSEELRRNIRGPESRVGQFSKGRTEPYIGLAQCLTELGQLEESLQVLERGKARTLGEIFQQGRVLVSHAIAQEERANEAEFVRAVTERMNALTTVEASKPGAEAVAEARRQLAAAQDRLMNYRRLLYAAHPELEVKRAEFHPTNLKALGDLLFRTRPGLVMLSYLVTGERTYVFVLTGGDNPGDAARLVVYPVSVKEPRLAKAVEEYAEACANPGLVPASPDLVRWLLKPAAKELGVAKEVVIIPDGVLHRLPFHALRGQDEPYPIQQYPVSYAPSATALVKMTELAESRRKERERDGAVLAVGISDFGKREKPLAEAEKEAKAVGERFQLRASVTATTLLGPDATKAKIEAKWANCRYLHFATHGEFNPASPLFSSLLVTPAGRDEGRLYARDVLEIELKAELAVLSACKTGVGRVMDGEGLLGMGWAWFVAGVPSLVVSQWSVDDTSTAKLMTAFYTKLLGGATKAEALRHAQLTLLKEAATSHPFYWAPFIVLGDAGN